MSYVIVFRPNEPTTLQEVVLGEKGYLTLEQAQNLVEGHVVYLSLREHPHVTLLANEEGLPLGLPPCVKVPHYNVLYGPCALVKQPVNRNRKLLTFDELEALGWWDIVSKWPRIKTQALPERSMGDFSRCPLCFDTDCYCSDVITRITV